MCTNVNTYMYLLYMGLSSFTYTQRILNKGWIERRNGQIYVTQFLHVYIKFPLGVFDLRAAVA